MIGDDASTGGPSQRSAREFVDFAEAVGALLLAALVIAILPFRQLTRTIAKPSLRTGRTGPRCSRG